MLANFDISQHVEFNSKGRGICPACALSKGTNHRELNLSLMASGAYKCHAGCTTEEIRETLGTPKPTIIPMALAKPEKGATVSPQKVKEAHDRLMGSDGPAKQWLNDRGITDAMMARHQLGITRAKSGDRHLPAITIPLPANADGTQYYQKKRVAPWLTNEEQPAGYQPWSQYGIPAQVFFTWLPVEATETYLCEGEWDAILLGEAMRAAGKAIAVASFTCGAGTVPPIAQLNLLPGSVTIFYDRNDKPLANGTRPGEEGSKKVAAALGDRAAIALVPMPADSEVTGWDVSDALGHGFTLADFEAAAGDANQPASTSAPDRNPLRSRLVSTDQLVARAPEFVEWLVPDILTADELFAIGAPPRGGKSLMCMLLAKCIATGQNFLDRPVTKGSVLYVNLEDSDAKVRERIESQEWAEGLPVYWLDKFKLNEVPHLIEIADEMDDLRLIILDTLSRVRSDDVSESSAEMSQVLEPLQEFAKTRKVCVLLVHHTRKLSVENSSVDDLFDSLRGSTAIRGTCRGMLIIAPGDNCYRLAVENGWGKHDLKIRMDGCKAEWQLLGKWNPAVNLDQKQMVLDFLNRVGNASIELISEETAIPKRSLYTVLDRLCQEGSVQKIGSRKTATYQRPIQLIQQLNSLLNSANVDTELDRSPIQQKNIIFSKGDHRQSDHPTHAKDDHFAPSDQGVITPVEFGKPHTERDTGQLITFEQKKKVLSVELGDQQPLNADRKSVSAIQ